MFNSVLDSSYDVYIDTKAIKELYTCDVSVHFLLAYIYGQNLDFQFIIMLILAHLWRAYARPRVLPVCVVYCMLPVSHLVPSYF